MTIGFFRPWCAALAFAIVGAVSPIMALADEVATCDSGQLQDIVGKGMAAIARHDDGHVLTAGATLHMAGDVCRDFDDKATGFLYGDYFLAYGFYWSGRVSDARRYEKDGIAIVRILNDHGEDTEIANRMRLRFEQLQGKLK